MRYVIFLFLSLFCSVPAYAAESSASSTMDMLTATSTNLVTTNSTTPVAVTSTPPVAPLILQMADGRFYHPVSGLMAASREELLRLLNGGPVAPPSSTTSTPLVIPPTVPLVIQAVRRGKQELRGQFPEISAKMIKNLSETWTGATFAVWDDRTDALTYTRVPMTVPSKNRPTLTLDDPHLFVVAVRYPVVEKIKHKKKKATYRVSDIVTTPSSDPLRRPDVAMWGKRVMDDLVQSAIDQVRTLGVRSRARPSMLLADVADPVTLKSIMAIEHLGTPSLKQDVRAALDRFFMNVALNENDAYASDRSSARALGFLQFIPSTYASVVKRWPALNLEPNFERGMRDIHNATVAQIAYLDDIWQDLPDGILTASTTSLEQARAYTVAAYNAGGIRVRRAIETWGEDWDQDHRAEQQRLEREAGALKIKIRALKTKIKKDKKASVKRKDKAALAEMQTHFQKDTDTIARMDRNRLKAETVDYIKKYALIGTFFEPTAVAVANGVSSPSSIAP